jgi:hypothetical protein
VLIAQDRPLVERFLRQPDGQWLLSAVEGMEASLKLSGIDARLELADLYRGVELPANPGR